MPDPSFFTECVDEAWADLKAAAAPARKKRARGRAKPTPRRAGTRGRQT